MATVIRNMALLYHVQGRYAEAEPLYRSCIALLEKSLGAESPNLIDILDSLAEVCRFQEKYDDAERFYRLELEIQEKNFGAGHPSVARSLENLMTIFTDRGNFSEAERIRERARAIRSGFAPRFGLRRSEHRTPRRSFWSAQACLRLDSRQLAAASQNVQTSSLLIL